MTPPPRVVTSVNPRYVSAVDGCDLFCGERPVTPDAEALIRQVCVEDNRQGLLQFDGETTDYVW